MANGVQTVQRFYEAFAALDAARMAECYAPAARFSDPVFTLEGRREIGAMWGMLCEAVTAKGRDVWSLEVGPVRVDDGGASVHWEARYRFSGTGRIVHNRIDARMRLDASGLILEHVDRFDFWRWSRQALGAPGYALGWSPVLRRRVQAQARARLERYLARAPDR